MADSAVGEPNRRDMAWIDLYRDHAVEFDDKITKFSDATRRVLDELMPL